MRPSRKLSLMKQRETRDKKSVSKISSNKTLIFSDLHIHSKYSRATSMEMNLESIARFGELKGLNLIGTGDFTHPKWIKNLKASLIEISNTNLYRLKTDPTHNISFMITGEVCTIFSSAGKVRKIHHLLLTPSIETAQQINDKILLNGDLSIDGRPILAMRASELVEKIMEVSKDNAVIPAHIWTPWYSLFGSINGFEKIEDCYEDSTRHIFALETGLSSDPPMNWRISSIDRFTLISNSDSHSPYPYRLGREANAFEVENLSYDAILKAIRENDSNKFKFTIETNPAYGKYHWTGHRACGVSMSPNASKKLGGRCPKCNKPMTRGVDERVEDLANRQLGYKPQDAINYLHLLPLHEVIRTALNIKSLYSPSIWRIFNKLISVFNNEYNILLNIPFESLKKATEPTIAKLIIDSRYNRVKIIPGSDGVYGKIELFDENKSTMQQNEKIQRKQSSLELFI